jgi:hypothetical protein
MKGRRGNGKKGKDFQKPSSGGLVRSFTLSAALVSHLFRGDHRTVEPAPRVGASPRGAHALSGF